MRAAALLRMWRLLLVRSPPLAISGDLVLVWQHLHCDTWLLAGAGPSYTSSFRRRTAASACLLCRDELASVSGCSRHRHLALWPIRLQLLVAHGCCSWRPTAATSGGARLSPTDRGDPRRQLQLVRKHLAAASAPGGCFCFLAAASAPGGCICSWRLASAPRGRFCTWRLRLQTSASGTP
ncbi:unnamed protein product [Closterium sp. NIES-65]|nr:unnamed protein product [Closterium sp. NIES-65]